MTAEQIIKQAMNRWKMGLRDRSVTVEQLVIADLRRAGFDLDHRYEEAMRQDEPGQWYLVLGSPTGKELRFIVKQPLFVRIPIEKETT